MKKMHWSNHWLQMSKNSRTKCKWKNTKKKKSQNYKVIRMSIRGKRKDCLLIRWDMMIPETNRSKLPSPKSRTSYTGFRFRRSNLFCLMFPVQKSSWMSMACAPSALIGTKMCWCWWMERCSRRGVYWGSEWKTLVNPSALGWGWGKWLRGMDSI